MHKVEHSLGKLLLTFIIALGFECVPCQSQVPFASVAKTPIASKTPIVARTTTAKPTPTSTVSTNQKPPINQTPTPIPQSKYKICAEQVNQLLTFCLRNIENTNHAFPDYVLIKQQCYASHETSIQTVCSCYLNSPPELCFNPKLRNEVKCDIQAKAQELACRIKTGNRTLCKSVYRATYQTCVSF